MRARTLLLGVLVLVLATGGVALATEPTVAQLASDGGQWAGAVVTVDGELVGDYGTRDDGAVWTQLNSDAYSVEPVGAGGEPIGGNVGIGVRIPAGLADHLDPPGRHGQRGPVVQVTGVWRWHDPGRQGESYLDVSMLTILEPGYTYVERGGWGPVAIVGWGLILAAVVVGWRHRHLFGLGDD